MATHPPGSLGKDLWFSLESWVVQDGAFPDVRVGEVHRSAIEFRGGEPGAYPCWFEYLRYIAENIYDVCGSVVDSQEDMLVFKIGDIRLVRFVPPGETRDVTQVSGLGRCYLTRLVRDGSVLVEHEWYIKDLFRQAGPWVRLPDGQRIRDPEHPQWRRIRATSARNDDEGTAIYLVHAVIVG